MEDLKRDFDNLVAGIAWSLWRELGVAGTDRFHENCLIQPEELIILTSLVSDHDPRLRDEALDWSSRYHESISVSRLRTLLKGLDLDAVRSFSRFAALLNEISSAKWPQGEESPSFKVQISGKSLLPSLESSSLLMLRLRSLFGPGAKADILTHLLTRSGINFSAADLVEIGYSKRNLLTALDHLAASGVLIQTSIRNKKNYELSRAGEWQVVVGKLPKIAPPWSKILQAIVTIRSVIPHLQNKSEETKNVILRNSLINIEPLLPSFLSPILNNSPSFERDWKVVLRILNGFRQGNFFNQYEVYDQFEKILAQFLSVLYPVDDCVVGIEEIEGEVGSEPNRHKEVYKACYQLFLSFVRDLEACLKQFLEFPIHKMMDEPLSDISYQFSKEKFPRVLEKIKEIKSIDQITNVQLAIRQYRAFMPEAHVVRQFILTIYKRLKDLFFVRTHVNLLVLPTTLHKRHLVLDLFHEQK